MASIDNLRNDLIDKILTIRNPDFITALDKLISSSAQSEKIVALTPEQKLMLEMSKRDIANGDLISQDDLNAQDLAWLNEQ